MVSFRPAFSRPLPLTALLPLFVACGPSDGGITVDEDDTTSTGSPTSGSSSAGTTSSVAGTGGSDPTGGGDTTLVGVEPPGADWACRQREISEMIQHHETGPKQIKETTVHGSSA